MATDKCDPTADIDTLERHRDQAVELFEAFERRLNELTAVLPESDSRELARWAHARADQRQALRVKFQVAIRSERQRHEPERLAGLTDEELAQELNAAEASDREDQLAHEKSAGLHAKTLAPSKQTNMIRAEIDKRANANKPAAKETKADAPGPGEQEGFF